MVGGQQRGECVAVKAAPGAAKGRVFDDRVAHHRIGDVEPEALGFVVDQAGVDQLVQNLPHHTHLLGLVQIDLVPSAWLSRSSAGSSAVCNWSASMASRPTVATVVSVGRLRKMSPIPQMPKVRIRIPNRALTTQDPALERIACSMAMAMSARLPRQRSD